MNWAAVGPRLKWILIALGPLMFAAFPALSLFVRNQSEVELGVLWLPLALSLGAATVLFGILLLLTRRQAKAAVLSSVVVLALLYYGVFFDGQSRSIAIVWLLAFAVVAVALVRTARDVGNLGVILAAAAIVMALPQAVHVVTYQAAHPSVSARDRRLWPTTLATPSVANGARRPDIYVIVPDDYARADVMQQYFHFDNRAFEAALEQRGFVLAPQNRSPYSDSESNIAALVNMDYLSNLTRLLGKKSTDVRVVKRVIADNRAARLLSRLGYDYVHIDTDEVTFSGGNPHISPGAPPDSFVNLWLRKSMFHMIGGPIGFNQSSTDARFRTSVRSQFARLSGLRTGARPKFVLFHTLLPHDPYVFDASGHNATLRSSSDRDLSSANGRALYRAQLEYTSKLMLNAVDAILAHATTPPVIVVHADEGFQADPTVFGEAAMKDIRVKGISAMYLPGLDHPGLPNPPNSVNTLRFVFNQYFSAHYNMLDSHSYAETDFPYDFSDEIAVTP